MEKQRTDFFDKELWYRIKIHQRTLTILIILLTLVIVGTAAYQYRKAIYEYVNQEEIL